MVIACQGQTERYKFNPYGWIMGTDVKGRTCLRAEDKFMIQTALSIANQKVIEVRGFLQSHQPFIKDEPAVEVTLAEISKSIKLVQDLPTCDEEDMLINSAKYAARALQKATGEEVYI